MPRNKKKKKKNGGSEVFLLQPWEKQLENEN